MQATYWHKHTAGDKELCFLCFHIYNQQLRNSGIFSKCIGALWCLVSVVSVPVECLKAFVDVHAVSLVRSAKPNILRNQTTTNLACQTCQNFVRVCLDAHPRVFSVQLTFFFALFKCNTHKIDLCV